MRTAPARIAKAIQPHWVLLDSSVCDAAAAAAAAAAAGLTPDVVVVPEFVVVAGGGATAITVVVWDFVTVGVACVGAVTVGVDRVGVVTVGVDRVGSVRDPEPGSVPTADPFPPPHAARNPAANNPIMAAAASRLNETWARLVNTSRRSHRSAVDPSPDRDELRRSHWSWAQIGPLGQRPLAWRSPDSDDGEPMGHRDPVGVTPAAATGFRDERAQRHNSTNCHNAEQS
jgi:hypothetical protein